MTTVWQCDPPPEGVRFRVLSEEWDGAFTTRTITAWQPAADWEVRVEAR